MVVSDGFIFSEPMCSARGVNLTKSVEMFFFFFLGNGRS